MERLCNDVRLSCKLLYVLWIQKSLLFAIASGGRWHVHLSLVEVVVLCPAHFHLGIWCPFMLRCGLPGQKSGYHSFCCTWWNSPLSFWSRDMLTDNHLLANRHTSSMSFVCSFHCRPRHCSVARDYWASALAFHDRLPSCILCSCSMFVDFITRSSLTPVSMDASHLGQEYGDLHACF